MESVPEINVLSEDVANKIAAGEVIERPAAAVKELLENSLDARASKIDIEFANGGKTFIKVSDNGHGMRKDQLLTCLKPHATSKIKNADDLESILSFGFRGEAIPSIASVSKFIVCSKTQNDLVGARLEVFAGKIGQMKELAMSNGTEISVEELFCSVPARRKFLKSDNTEASHIIKMCKLYALAKSDVEFSLKENGKLLFKSKKTSSLIERVKYVFGEEISSKLVNLTPYSAFGIRVEGAISKPIENWASSRNIFAFINGRPVECRAIFSALKEAYQKAMPQGRYPAAFLFITLDPKSVDVNVHPAKREVRLKNEFAMRSAILASVIDTLENYSISDSKNTQTTLGSNSHNPVKIEPCRAYEFDEPKFEESPKLKEILDNSQIKAPKISSNPLDFKPIVFEKKEEKFEEKRDEISKEAELVLESLSHKNLKKDAEVIEQEIPQKEEVRNVDLRPSSSLGWKYLKHLSKKYALFETQSNSLILLSIPSAFKRINYEKIVRNFEGEKAKSQNLLIPVNIEFDRADDEVFSRNISAFKTCGFAIEEFGERFYRICATPLWIDFGDIEKFIKDFIELAKEEGFSIQRKTLSEQTFAKMASDMARGTQIIESEYAANLILDELFACKSPMFTPDGKRTCKEITSSEIRTFFGE